jgi:thiol-disulfide isomerase/thioredoxin
MRVLLAICGVLALAGCHKAAEQQQPANQSAGAPTPAPDSTGIKGIHRDHKGQPAPDASFTDAAGQAASLAKLTGKPLLVNLWATWCAPCVKELPTLDQLARQGNGSLQVVAISQDMGPHASVVAFLKEHRIATLAAYQDPKMSLSGALGAEVLPTTILFDAQGHEVWRYVGDLDWTSPAAAKLVAEAGGGAPASR